MTIRRSIFALAVSAAAFLAPAALAAKDQAAAPQALPTATPTSARPALWKIADHDTTIYLFGTIHVLPQGIDWYQGPIRHAFEHSDLLMTELPDLSTGEVAAAMLKQGLLPKGETLRSLMSEEQRGKYDATLTKLGLQPAMFDHNRPWVVALLLPLVRVQQLGFDPQHGVEANLSRRAKELNRTHQGLETIDAQLGIFAALNQQEQMDYLMAVVDALPQVDSQIQAMVGSWSKGDAKGLAALLNADEDPALGEALIYNRNRNWAKWISARMKQPGTVFIAVGAGHLAGKGSVQDELSHSGYRASRVQ